MALHCSSETTWTKLARSFLHIDKQLKLADKSNLGKVDGILVSLSNLAGAEH